MKGLTLELPDMLQVIVMGKRRCSSSACSALSYNSVYLVLTHKMEISNMLTSLGICLERLWLFSLSLESPFTLFLLSSFTQFLKWISIISFAVSARFPRDHFFLQTTVKLRLQYLFFVILYLVFLLPITVKHFLMSSTYSLRFFS